MKRAMRAWRHGGVALAAALALAAFALPGAAAERCRDAAGKFVKCRPAPAPTNRCRDVTTKKFVRCGSANSEAVPAPTSR